MGIQNAEPSLSVSSFIMRSGVIHIHQDIEGEIHPLDRSSDVSGGRVEATPVPKRREDVSPKFIVLLQVRFIVPEAFETLRPPSIKHIQHSGVYFIECCIIHLGSRRILNQPVNAQGLLVPVPVDQ